MTMYGPGRPERRPSQTPTETPQLSHRIDSFATYDSYDSLDAYQLAAVVDRDEDRLLDVPLTEASSRRPRFNMLSRHGHQPLRTDDPDDVHDPDDGIRLTTLVPPAGMPLPTPTDAFLQDLHAQEASGTLTLGLGAGFGPGAQLREAELLATAAAAAAEPWSPVSSVGRALSRRWTTGRGGGGGAHSRRDTIRALAQNEANRRGETVEVLLEEEEEEEGGDRGGPAVDLSVAAGSLTARTGTTTTTMTTAVIAHPPQPDWRPAVMRGPYLALLVVLSAGLGAAQELLYRRAARAPLVVFRRPEEIPAGLYFAVKFAPTLVAVAFGALWQGTDCAVKRLEAFYQLSREDDGHGRGGEGAAAEVSLTVDYVSSMALWQPLQALRCGHDAVAVSAAAALLAVSLVPTLASAAVVLRPDGAARRADPHGEKQVVVDAVTSRALTATLGVIAVLGAVLLVRLQRRRSGLAADVRGIAGVAAMAVVSHILQDFRGMDLATHGDIHARLRGRRYVLRNGSLAPVDGPMGMTFYQPAPTLGAAGAGDDNDGGHRRKENPHPLMLRPAGCLPYVACILLFAGLVSAVVFAPAAAAATLLDRTPWLLTALAVGLRLGWAALAAAVRLLEPYALLARRHAPARTLTLDYAATPYVWGALQALARGHWLVFLVGCGTVLTEVLTVLVSSLAGGFEGSTEETRVSFYVSLGLTHFLLAYMAAVAMAVLVRRRRPFLPRQPTTIAAVLAFLHQSKLLWALVGASRLPSPQLRARLEAPAPAGHTTTTTTTTTTYGFGWFAGRDGQPHCGIDHEELLSAYQVGYDYSRSIKPWEEEAVEWL